MRKIYLVWNLTNYGVGYEFLGAYTTLSAAREAYKKHMKASYGTDDEDELLNMWDDAEAGNADSWMISSVNLYGKENR